MLIKCDMCEKVVDTTIARADGLPAAVGFELEDGDRITACTECIIKVNENPEYLDDFLKARWKK